MEDTQMPSVGAPQGPQQEANPNPPVSSIEPATSPTPKKGGGLIKTLVGVFAIAILGFGGWYAYDSGLFDGDSDDTPPSLKIAGAGFQGKSVDTTFGFLQFDAADESGFDSTGMNLKQANNGVNYFTPLQNTTFDVLANSVKATSDLKMLVVRYDKTKPWAGDASLNGCFSVYPVGPYDKTCEVAEDKLIAELVMKGDSIALITNVAFEYDSNLLADAKILGDTLNLTDAKGWSMHSLSASMDLTDPRIKSLWVQKSQNEFEKVTDVNALDLNREYKMAWFKIGTPTSIGDATGGGETGDDTPVAAVCGNGSVETGEACDDGTNNSDTIANGCRTTCVVAACGDGVVDTGEECDGSTDCEADCTLTPVAPVCGDGNVDPGEECDGTADCEADCTLTPVVTEVCGNNTIDGSDVCDGTDLDGKTCTNLTTEDGSTFSEGTLGCAADCSAFDTSQCATGAPSGGTEDTSSSIDVTRKEPLITFDKSMITAPVFDRSTSVTTSKTGNAYVEHVQYIDNIENEFPDITIPSNIRGKLYTSKEDSTPDYIPVTAIEVKAGGTTGNIKLNLARFYSTGYIQADSNAQLEYCNGAGDWEFYRIQENAQGGVNDQVVFTLKEDMIAERGHYTFKDTSDFSYDPIVATINAGESAVFFLLMEDMSACRNASTGTAWSQTDITKLIFTEGDLNEKIYLKTDIIHQDQDRKIYWLDSASGGSAATGVNFKF